MLPSASHASAAARPSVGHPGSAPPALGPTCCSDRVKSHKNSQTWEGWHSSHAPCRGLQWLRHWLQGSQTLQAGLRLAGPVGQGQRSQAQRSGLLPPSAERRTPDGWHVWDSSAVPWLQRLPCAVGGLASQAPGELCRSAAGHCWSPEQDGPDAPAAEWPLQRTRGCPSCTAVSPQPQAPGSTLPGARTDHVTLGCSGRARTPRRVRCGSCPAPRSGAIRAGVA